MIVVIIVSLTCYGSRNCVNNKNTMQWVQRIVNYDQFPLWHSPICIAYALHTKLQWPGKSETLNSQKTPHSSSSRSSYDVSLVSILEGNGCYITGRHRIRHRFIKYSLHIQTACDDVIEWKYFPRCWPLVRNSPVTGEFPSQRPVTRSFDIFFDVRLNKRLGK